MAQRFGARSAAGGGRRDRAFHLWRVVAAFALLGTLAAYAWFWTEGKAVGSGLFVVPLLFLLTAPALVRVSRTETRFDLAGIMATGLALRFAATYYAFDHAADAGVYNQIGTQLARQFRTLHFSVDTGAPVPGTGGLRFIAGLVSVPAGSNEFAKFCVFTWLAFLGCVLFYRAFETALPQGDHRRYALLIFLWPSLVFWPSSLGKEAWMLLTMGVAMLGVARVFTRTRGGYTLMFAGLLAGSVVRPNIGLLIVLAFAIALFLGRRQSARPGTIAPSGVAKFAGLILVLLLGGYLVTRTQQLIDPGDTGAASTVATAQQTVQDRTAIGGSAFNSADPNSPTGYAKAAITVLFRPFPTESHGFQELVASAEALFLFGLTLASWRRLWGLCRRLRAEPYYMLAAAYLLMFIYAFAVVANFGILTRERTQLDPFLFVLLAAPAPMRVRPSRSRGRLLAGS
jgi:hypothetical protein